MASGGAINLNLHRLLEVGGGGMQSLQDIMYNDLLEIKEYFQFLVLLCCL